MKKILLVLIAVPLLLAAQPAPTATLVLRSENPVTVQAVLDREPNGRHSSYSLGGELRCSNGYAGFDRVNDNYREPFVFDGTENVVGTPGLTPGGSCTLTARIGQAWQGTVTYSDLGSLSFNLGG